MSARSRLAMNVAMLDAFVLDDGEVTVTRRGSRKRPVVLIDAVYEYRSQRGGFLSFSGEGSSFSVALDRAIRELDEAVHSIEDLDADEELSRTVAAMDKLGLL